MRRRAIAGQIGAVILLLQLGLYAVPTLAADSPFTVHAPTNLSMLLPGATTPLAPGSWIRSSQVLLQFQIQVDATPLTPQIEIQPLSVPFKGQPNGIGPALSSSGSASISFSGLSDSTRYHWQARVVDPNGNASSWVPYAANTSSGFDVGVDQTPPSRPTVTSPTNPSENQWYHNRVVALRWTSEDSYSGLLGFSYVLERQAHVIPPGAVTKQAGIKLSDLADGVWFLALRSVDRAGNWSPTATFRLQLDRQAPRISWLSPPRTTFNPYKGPISVRFSVDKDANVDLSLYRVGDQKAVTTFSYRHLRAGQTTTVTWNGKDAKGRLLKSGYYFFSARAIDHAANILHLNVGGIALNAARPSTSPSGQVLYPGDGKRIIVSVARQTLYAYDGTRLIVQTYVTTGNPNLPTPLGSYTIMAKYHPFQFISPWPHGSPYWYPPSWSQYAMLFRDGGYFLHDAPWRAAFGPGTNGAGQPGTNYGGTHGCVNIPPGPMWTLWNWAPEGTLVQVVP